MKFLEIIYKFFGWHCWLNDQDIFGDPSVGFKTCKFCGIRLWRYHGICDTTFYRKMINKNSYLPEDCRTKNRE